MGESNFVYNKCEKFEPQISSASFSHEELMMKLSRQHDEMMNLIQKESNDNMFNEKDFDVTSRQFCDPNYSPLSKTNIIDGTRHGCFGQNKNYRNQGLEINETSYFVESREGEENNSCFLINDVLISQPPNKRFCKETPCKV